ncbi:UNKNOWN [Stylonychia lemnae]|uniref:Uncharacterized protein n=1 Tax=Stylonychia lemnae TaxID=5949 RepID=A0A078AWF3_STYLE|nr:UNKNOWN [Stylonychia lemnae]|eukprot:CDW86479.1 UNKNOWN [Stylonychia lemnae]
MSRYNDEILTSDPNKRLQVPPGVKEVQVFTQTLHKLSKVNVPKLAIERMENYEIDKKDKEYNKLINDNKYIKLKIPGRTNQPKNGSPRKSKLERSILPHNVMQELQNDKSQTANNDQQMTIMEETELRRKQILEAEERLRNRNKKSQRELIVKNPLGYKEDDYDTKVYKNQINKNDRTNDISMVDEGKQMVFALPSISTKGAKVLHGLVNQNIIKDDRLYRTQCRSDRNNLNSSRNLTLTRCAFYPPTEFSIIKDSFIKKLNVKDGKSGEERKGNITNQSKNMDFMNHSTSSLGYSPDRKENDSTVSNRSLTQRLPRNNSIRRSRTIGSFQLTNLQKMHQTIQHFYNPNDADESGKILINLVDNPRKTINLSPFRSPSKAAQETFSLELNKLNQGISAFNLYTPNSTSKQQQMSPTQHKKLLMQRQIEKQFEMELKKFEEPLQPNKFAKAVDFFQQAYDPNHDDPFKRKVASKILQHINMGELNEKVRMLGGGSQSGARRLQQYEIFTKKLTDNVIDRIKKAKLMALDKKNEILSMQNQNQPKKRFNSQDARAQSQQNPQSENKITLPLHINQNKNGLSKQQ